MCAHTRRARTAISLSQNLICFCLKFAYYFYFTFYFSTLFLQVTFSLPTCRIIYGIGPSVSPEHLDFLCRTFDTNQIIIQNSISCDLVVIFCTFNVWLFPSSLMWHYGNQFSWFTIQIYFVWGLLIKIIRNNSSDKSINCFLIIHEMIW